MVYDVLILGGGLIGLSIAEELARRGQKVVLLERSRCGQEASAAAAGMLTAQAEFRKPDALFELCQAARTLYPRWVAHIEGRAKQRVGYSADGALVLAKRLSEAQALDKQVRWQRRYGLPAEALSLKEARRRITAVDGRFKKAFFFTKEAQVDPVALGQAVLAAARSAGVRIQEQAEVRRLLLKHGRVQGAATAGEEFHARHVVVALGSWSALNGPLAEALPVKPIRGQILCVQAGKGSFRPLVMTSSTYLVQRNDGRLLIGATVEDVGFEKQVTLQGIHELTAAAVRISSRILHLPVIATWSGLRPATRDGLPILGPTGVEGLWAATGHYRHGILLAPITAQVMSDLILKGSSEVALQPFSPARFG